MGHRPAVLDIEQFGCDDRLALLARTRSRGRSECGWNGRFFPTPTSSIGTLEEKVVVDLDGCVECSSVRVGVCQGLL